MENMERPTFEPSWEVHPTVDRAVCLDGVNWVVIGMCTRCKKAHVHVLKYDFLNDGPKGYEQLPLEILSDEMRNHMLGRLAKLSATPELVTR